MKEYIFTELGYFTEKECENMKKALDGFGCSTLMESGNNGCQ